MNKEEKQQVARELRRINEILDDALQIIKPEPNRAPKPDKTQGGKK